MRERRWPGMFTLVLWLASFPLLQFSESFCLVPIKVTNSSDSRIQEPQNRPGRLSTSLSPSPSVILSQSSVAFLVETPSQPGDPRIGEALFTGRDRLANGGPPCISCHSVSGIPFPNGGTMGPDLTGVYARFGPEGMAAALDSLFFVTMQPLYNNRPLTPTEQQDLAAFFRQSGQNQPRHGITVEFGLVSLAGCFGLFVLNGVIGKKRLRGVRRNLVARARSEGTKRS